MQYRLLTLVISLLVITTTTMSAPDKITKGWLWMAVPTGGGGQCGKDATGDDWLKKVDDNVTEVQIAKNGAQAGDKVGDKVWTKGDISGDCCNNVNNTINAIGLGNDNNNDLIVSYALIALDSPEKQIGKDLHTGSGDAIKVWLNGEVVQEIKKNRGAGDFQEQTKISLKKGENLLLVAVYECGGGWSMYVGIDAEFQTKQPSQAIDSAVDLTDKLVTVWSKIKNSN